MGVSEILSDVGNEGLFQIMVVVTILTTQMPILWGLTMMSYASYEPDWCCTYDRPELRDPNDTCVTVVYSHGPNGSELRRRWIHTDDDGDCDGMDALSQCHDKRYLDDRQASTAVTEWDLTCDRDWIVKVISATQMLGVLIGALCSGMASDWLGRKGIYIASLFTHSLFNMFAAMSDSWETFALYRFFIGMSIGFFLVVHFPYMVEFLSPRWRFIPTAVPIGSLGASTLPLAAWLVPDWMWLHIITGLLTGLLMIPALFIPESVRWLTIKGRVGEAVEVTETIAKVNRKMRDFDPDAVFDQIKNVSLAVQRKKAKANRPYSYMDLYLKKETAWLTIRLQILWFSNALITYGVIFDVDGLSGDIYTNMAILGLVDVPVIIFTYCIAKWASRKWTAGVYAALATLASITALVANLTSMPGHDDVVTAMCVLAKALLAGGMFVVIAVVTSEMYPTVIRSYGIGATNVAAKMGGILAPFVIDVDDMATMSFSIASTMCVLSTVIIMTLDESKDVTMEDGEDLNSNSGQSRRESFHQSISSNCFLHSYHQESDYDDDNDDDDDGGGGGGGGGGGDYIVDDVSGRRRVEFVDKALRGDTRMRCDNRTRSPTEKRVCDEPFLAPGGHRTYGSVSSTSTQPNRETTFLQEN